MEYLRNSRRTILTAAAVATLTLSGVVASANADQSGTGRPGAKTFTTTVVGFGAWTGVVSADPEDRDPTVHATNNTLAVSPDERFAVATNSDSDHLVVIEVRSGRKIAEIKGYVSPRNVLFAPDSKSFTVSDSARGVVDRISVATRQVEQRLPLGAGVFGTAQSKDGKWLYANNAAADTVTVVDLDRNRPEDVLTGFAEPRQGVQLSSAGDELYVTNFAGDRISVVDLRGEEPTRREIGGFDDVRGLSVSRDGTRLYAANSADDTISVVDTRSGETLKKVPVGDKPYGAALSPDETVLFSGNMAADTLTAVDPRTGTPTGTVKGLKGPRQAISFSADSRTAWVLNEDLTVAEVDVHDLQVTRTLGGEAQPGPR